MIVFDNLIDKELFKVKHREHFFLRYMGDGVNAATEKLFISMLTALRGVGRGEGERSAPPPQKIFRFLSSKRRVLVHPWCYFFAVD